MKQLVLITFFFAVFQFTLKAQKLYFNLYGNYSLPLAGNTFAEDGYDSGISYTATSKKISLGSGLFSGVRFGYMFSEKVGAEIGVNYGFRSTKFNANFTNIYSNTYDIYDGTIYAKNILSIQPCVRFALGENKISPYFRLGLNLPIQQKIIEENTFLATSSNNSTYTKKEITGSFSLGLAGGFGINYKLSSKVSLFSEINFVVQSIYASKAVITELKTTTGGVTTDVLPTLSTSQKEIEYSTNPSALYASNPNNPRQLTTYSIPFSTIGLMLGVVYQIGKNY